MRIKADFVTNSSSTAYVVYVPEEMVIPDNLLLECSKTGYFNEGDTVLDPETGKEIELDESNIDKYAIAMAKQTLEKMKQGYSFVSSDYDDTEVEKVEYNIASEISSKFNLEIAEVSTSGDGMNCISCITIKKINDIRKRILSEESLIGIIKK